MNQKIKVLREKLKALNIDGMIITNPISIKYLININAEGYLLITRKENIYITDSRYIEYANSVLTIEDEIIVTNIKDVSNNDYENFFFMCENVGFEENHISYKQYRKILPLYKCRNLVETENVIEKLRLIKDEEEIANIKKACEITDVCFEHLTKYIKKGMTEKEIALEIEKFFSVNLSEGISFSPIVASGENSSKPHHIPTNRKIQSGDVIIIDIGCKYNGYASDMTRTFFIDYISNDIKKIYDIVLKNNLQCIKEAKIGKEIKILSKMVDSDFNLYNQIQIHALGHGVGLEVHEGPFLTGTNLNLFKENMVIAIEPGIYLPGKFGVRIEDVVYISNENARTLSNFKKEYVIIK